MGFVVNSLPEYIKENGRELLVKSIFTAPTANLINVQTGVKHKAALNILSVDPVLKERACGWDPSGNTTFTQREIVVGRYEMEEELCVEEVAEKYLNEQTITAATGSELPFEEEIVAETLADIQRKVEDKIWNASTGAGDLFDGLVTILDKEGVAVDTSTATTIYDKVVEVYKAIPVSQIDKAEIFMGVDDFKLFCLELVSKNLYHYSHDLNPADLSYELPGTNTIIHGVSGLNGKHRIVAGNPKYMFWGTDLREDSEQFKVLYDEKADAYDIIVRFNLGAQVAFPDLIVIA